MFPYAQILKVANMYYVQRESVNRIANQLGISVATVSRMLREAERLGIVKFQVVDIRERSKQLEQRLKKIFPSVKEFVVKGNEDDSADLKQYLALSAVDVIIKFLKPGSLVGIGPGETMANLVRSFPRYRSFQDIKLLPLVGGWGLQKVEYENNKLVTELASILRCEYFLLPAPSYVSSGFLRETILKEPQIKPIVELWDSIDMAIFSIGPEVDHSLFKELIGNEEEIRAAKAAGAVGDVLGYLIDQDGNVLNLPFNQQLISFPVSSLKRIPTKVVVAGGRLKYRSILASLKAELIDILVTDEATANYLLDSTIEKGG